MAFSTAFLRPAPPSPAGLVKKQFGLLAVVVSLLHLYSLVVFGATFWFDSIVYATMGHEMFHGGLASFYAGDRYAIMLHIAPGIGWLWGVCTSLLGEQAWLGLAIFQHTVAVLAILYFLAGLQRLLSFRWLLVLGVILSLHPFVRAFDNALMTESVCGSMLLIAVGAALRIVYGEPFWRNAATLALASGVATQFRPYYFLSGLALLAIALLSQFSFRGWRTALLRFSMPAVFLVASYLFFPAVRSLALGQFVMTDGSFFLLAVALNSNPHPTPELLEDLRHYDLPDGFDPHAVAERGLDWAPWNELAQKMLARGDSIQDAERLFRRMRWRVRTDSWETIRNQLNLACCSTGMCRCDWWTDPDSLIRRKTTVRKFVEHTGNHYRWLAWVQQADYASYFDEFVSRFRKQPTWYPQAAIDEWATCTGSYLRVCSPTLRDPLFLRSIPLEIWFVAALGGIGVLCVRKPSAAGLVGTAMAMNFAVMLLSGSGNCRYAHSLISLYLTCTVVATAAIEQGLRRLCQRRVTGVTGLEPKQQPSRAA